MGWLRDRNVPDLFGKDGWAATGKMTPGQARKNAKGNAAPKMKGKRTLTAKEVKALEKTAKAAEKKLKK